ncbi:RidA family protein [Candidatus Bathyarchaeota archaeon]|nr:RidA family protein [Candidatus Bathyarchaeota archaeon]
MDSIKRVSWIDGITKPRASYSNFTKAGNFIFIAGQVGIDPDTGEIPIEFSKQMRIIFENIGKILESEGGSFGNIVKTTAFLSDSSYHEEYDVIYRSYFQQGFPSRSTIQSGLMHPKFKIEIEAVAYIP